LARLGALQLILTVLLTLAAAPYGLTAVAWAYVIRSYLTLPVQMWLLRHHSGVGYRAMLSAIAPPLSMALVMAGVLLALHDVVGAWLHHRGAFVLTMVLIGGTVYAVLISLFARRFVGEQVRDLKRLIPGASAEPSGAGAGPE
jgi:hypothetical protein